MKILKSWLKDYINFDLTDDELVSKLSLSGTEVENIHPTIDKQIIIVRIEKISPHPDADKLQIVEVSDGKEKFKIVCGAGNISVGQVVPLAKVGANVGGNIIKETEIRGEKSAGMLCSEEELGIGEDHSGIKILAENAPIGRPLAEFIKSDSILELEITPNRGDCLSHIGLAREIAALEASAIKKEPISLKMSPDRVADAITVEIENTNDCPHYFARFLSNIKIGPSPKWLQKRLIACGATPINNIVDVSNYIMLDLGQPLHAFDADKINDGKIIVRRAKNKENITTLDGKEFALSKDNLVIADKNKAIAIAGIMGGLNSEITAQTKNIIIEAAEFDPKVTRKSAKSLNLTTEASYRFERGIDSGGVQYAIDKAAKLMKEVAGGEIYSGIVKAGETTFHLYNDEIEYKKINNLLGFSLSESEIDHILKSLGFLIDDSHFITPGWRHDIECWQDLAEEIARIYGYNKIKPLALSKITSPKKSYYYFKENLKDHLADLGFSEVYNYSYLSLDDLKILNSNPKELLEIKNPMQPENKYLRNSLVPGILKTIAKNSFFDNIAIFEIGNVFTKTREKTNLIIASCGKQSAQFSEMIDKFTANFGVNSNILKTQVFKDKNLSEIKIRKPDVMLTEIDIENLEKYAKYNLGDLNLRISKDKIVYRPISRYPSVTRDLAFIVSTTTKPEDFVKDIYAVSELINRVELFDTFTSDKFGADRKNLAFHIFLQAPDRTLKDNEVNDIIKNTILKIEKKYKAKLRG